MKLFHLIGGLLNLVYLGGWLLGFTLLIFLFILVFPPVIGIVFALLVAVGITIAVHQHVSEERDNDR